MSFDARISVVVPTLNEQATIVTTLEAVIHDPYVHQCVVVDGGSSDQTVQRVEQMQASKVTLVTAPRGRASQMNCGVEQSNASIVLFVHADTKMPPRFGEKIVTVTNAGARWGCFSHRFDPSNWKLKLVSYLHNLRCRRTGVVYGDQAMFVKRSTFDSLGGFPDKIMEDVEFSHLALSAIGAPTVIDEKVATASRKFLQMGELKALGQVISIIRRHQRGQRVGNKEFFEPYR